MTGSLLLEMASTVILETHLHSTNSLSSGLLAPSEAAKNKTSPKITVQKQDQSPGHHFRICHTYIKMVPRPTGCPRRAERQPPSCPYHRLPACVLQVTPNPVSVNLCSLPWGDSWGNPSQASPLVLSQVQRASPKYNLTKQCHHYLEERGYQRSLQSLLPHFQESTVC